MNVRYRVELNQAERGELTALLSGGKHAARKLKRAQILLAADAGASNENIATSVGVGGSTVYRTKRCFVDGNLKAALTEEPRPGAARKLLGQEEALLVATACSHPPEGRARWTLDLLAGAMVKLTEHDSISRETVRRRLTENDLKPWRKNMWCILAPRLKVILGQAPTHGLSGYAVVLGQLDHRAGQQVQRPAGAAFRWVRAGSCHQEGFLLAQELASRSGARLFGQRRLQVTFNKAALGPIHGRAANSYTGRDVFIARPSIRGQQNLRALELARRVLAAAQKRREFAALGLVEFHPVAYIHRCLLMVEARTNS